MVVHKNLHIVIMVVLQIINVLLVIMMYHVHG